MGGAPEAALRPPGHLSHPQGQQASPAPTPSCPHPTECGGWAEPGRRARSVCSSLCAAPRRPVLGPGLASLVWREPQLRS